MAHVSGSPRRGGSSIQVRKPRFDSKDRLILGALSRAGPYSLTWRNDRGEATYPCAHAPGFWTNGAPAWIGPTRLGGDGSVTYPLGDGAWSNGRPTRVIGRSAQASFAPGASLSLSYWHDSAVDPRLIAHGSRIFVPAYCDTPSDGWFVAADTGGAIIGVRCSTTVPSHEISWSTITPPGVAM